MFTAFPIWVFVNGGHRWFSLLGYSVATTDDIDLEVYD